MAETGGYFTPRREVLKLTGNKTGIGKGKGQLFAVEKLGIVDEVLKHYKDGIPATKMANIFAKKGIKIAPLGINRWLGAQKKSAAEKRDVQNYQKYEMMVINYEQEITGILDEVKEMKNYAKEEKKLDSYTKLVGKLFQGLELLAKLMGDIKPKGTVDINIFIKELNKQTFDTNKNMRNSLFNADIIDVEAEITEDDKIHEDKLK